jgi:uncharacterized protein
MRFISIILLVFSIIGCSPDKVFLKPIKISNYIRNKNQIENDSTKILFTGKTYQPVFINNLFDSLSFPYTISSFIFPSESGNRLNGWFLENKEKTIPIAIIYFHGNSGNITTNYEFITPLLQYGFDIYIFDYSGFGFSEGKSTRQNILLDGLSATDYITSLPSTKQHKIIIYGQSFGGHLSTVVASMRQNKIDALVTESAFSSYDDAMTGIIGKLGRLASRELYSAKDSIKNFHKPVLIIQSTEDKVVPFYMAQTLYNNANNPKELYEITGKHVNGVILFHEEISDKIKKMLLYNL